MPPAPALQGALAPSHRWHFRRAKPLPMPYGQRRHKSPRRGRVTRGVLARCCAIIAVRVAPPLAALGSRSSQRSLCVAAKAASFHSLAHWASASLHPPLAALGSRSSQRSLCVAAKAASFNSLAHWASASLHPPLAALGSAPPGPQRSPGTRGEGGARGLIRPGEGVHRLPDVGKTGQQQGAGKVGMVGGVGIVLGFQAEGVVLTIGDAPLAGLL